MKFSYSPESIIDFCSIYGFKKQRDSTEKRFDKGELQKFLNENKIKVDNYEMDNFKPLLDFKSCYYTFFKNVYLNYKEPTLIQSCCWPVICEGRDLVGIAQTGSGKTLAFAIPAVKFALGYPRSNLYGPKVLILLPTRELAIQVNKEIEQLVKSHKTRTLCVYGGAFKGDQIKNIKKHPDIIVATPGRLIDLMEEKVVNLSDCRYCVLDEADRMLDFGFEDSVKTILDSINKNRQIVMFSATLPTSIQQITEKYLKNAARISIGSTKLTTNQNVEQVVHVLDTKKDPNAKDKKLIELLNSFKCNVPIKLIIFVLYKREVKIVEDLLRKHNHRTCSIHGNKKQKERISALDAFEKNRIPILIATDVAARGLDIPLVQYVINYTFPLTIDDYIHRIGRTGRAGNKGIAYTFFTSDDKAHSGELINVLKSINCNIPEELMNFGTTVKRKEHNDYGVFYKEIDPNSKPKKMKFDD